MPAVMLFVPISVSLFLSELASWTSVCCDTVWCGNINFLPQSVTLFTRTQPDRLNTDLNTAYCSPKHTNLSAPSQSFLQLRNPLWRSDDTLESSATLAPERDRPSPSPCPTPPPSPPPSPPPIPALTPHLQLPAVRRAVEDGEGKAEEGAHSSQPSADSFCKVMGLLGMGHRLFVPRLLAVRVRGLGHGDTG